MGINQGPISLDQKYTQGTGHVFMTGIQALVRLPMAQIRRDRAAGLNTPGWNLMLYCSSTTSNSSPA
jgi:indolepyruvate ferredoxin oxidoreductase